MRSTVRIDDDLMEELQAEARREKRSMTRTLNELLRAGLRARRAPARRGSRRFRQPTHALGAPRLDLDKALALAARLEDDLVAAKLAARK